jgi:hypothetical protein
VPAYPSQCERGVLPDFGPRLCEPQQLTHARPLALELGIWNLEFRIWCNGLNFYLPNEPISHMKTPIAEPMNWIRKSTQRHRVALPIKFS